MTALTGIGARLRLTSPRLRGEVGLLRAMQSIVRSNPGEGEAPRTSMFGICGSSPSPQPSKSELRSSRPREERGEGDVIDGRCRLNLNSSRFSIVIPGWASWRRPGIQTHYGGYGFRVRSFHSRPGMTAAVVSAN